MSLASISQSFTPSPNFIKILLTPPGRPIVSAINGPLEKVGQYIDSLLKTLVHALESFVRDTKDVLNMFDSIEVDERWLLVSIDVESLYTSMPRAWGYKADKFYLEMSHQNKLNLDLLNFVLFCLL